MANRLLLPAGELGSPAGSRPEEPPVVWRTWLLAPERGPRGQITPVLTGLYGFPWRSPHADAKCIVRDRARGYLASGTFTLDRHHAVIPDPYCTCGIYAGRDELVVPRTHPARGMPYVTGFVALRGRVLVTPTGYRAQQAHVVGPLTIHPGRPPLGVALARRFGAPLVPSRVVTGPIGYRTLWRPRRADALDTWLDETTVQLNHRYGVPVAVSSAGTRRNPPRG